MGADFNPNLITPRFSNSVNSDYLYAWNHFLFYSVWTNYPLKQEVRIFTHFAPTEVIVFPAKCANNIVYLYYYIIYLNF